MRYGEQQPLTLLHDALRFRFRLDDALAVATFALYVAQDVHYEYRRREDGEQTQHRYPHNHCTPRTHRFAHNTLQCVVLIALYILNQ